jgi:hypothetical protein
MTTIYEKYAERSGEAQEEASRQELVYIVTDTDSDLAVYQAALAHSPFQRVDPVSTSLLDRDSVQVRQVEGEIWEATVRYVHPGKKKKPEPETGEITIEWSTTGGTGHVKQSKRTIQKKAGPALDSITPDFRQAINVRTDGSGRVDVDGTDIVIPQLNFSITKYQPADFVDLAYVKKIAQATGKMNGDDFYGFAPGELLFLGGSGSQRNRGDWQVRYEFAYSENLSSVPIAPMEGLVLSQKKGWDYAWVYYLPASDDDAKVLIAKPAAAFIERIYDEAQFSELGI